MDPIKYTAQKLLEKNKLLFLFCILFIMTSLFLTCYVFFFRTVTIDVTKHIDIEYSGESGEATVTVSNNAYNLNQRTQEFLDSISYQVTPKSKLTNGTKLQIVAKYDENLMNKYHIKVINETKEVVVEGLPERFNEAKEIDADFQKTMDVFANRYFEKNRDEILKEDFTEFYSGSHRELVNNEHVYRVFLKANTHDNKDKVVDIYRLIAKGMVNISKGKEELVEQEAELYYMITYDDINSSRRLKEQNVFGEKIIGIEVDSQESLTQVLHQKYLLSYQFLIIK